MQQFDPADSTCSHLTIVALMACTGCAPAEVVDLSEMVVGPGIPSEVPGEDGTGWDATTPVPAAEFASLIAEGSNLTLNQAVALVAGYYSKFPAPSIAGSVSLSDTQGELDTTSFESCWVKANPFDCVPGPAVFSAADVDAARFLTIIVSSIGNDPRPAALMTLEADQLDMPAGSHMDKTSRAFNVVKQTGGAIISVNTRRYYIPSR